MMTKQINEYWLKLILEAGGSTDGETVVAIIGELISLREAVLKFVSAHKHGQDLGEKSVLYKKMKARAEGGGESWSELIAPDDQNQPNRPALDSCSPNAKPSTRSDDTSTGSTRCEANGESTGSTSEDALDCPTCLDGTVRDLTKPLGEQWIDCPNCAKQEPKE